MRAFLIAAATTAALVVAPSAYAQGQAEQPGAPAQQGGPASITSLNIIDLTELPEAARSQVDAAASKATEADLKNLRTSIDNSPEIKKALEAKGVTSSQVIVANLDAKGTLTLITKKAG